MGLETGQQDPREWHGARIVGELELDFHSDERALHRRRLRHNIIFGVLAGVVVLVLVLALLVFTGRLQLPGQPQPSVAAQQQPIDNLQCPTRDFTYLEPGKVRVRVLNATGESGMGARLAQLLEERGFQVKSVTSGVSDFADETGAVVAGPGNYAQAMSLQRHLPGALFVFDEAKRDGLVDFEVGKDFEALTKQRRLELGPGQLVCANPPEEAGSGN